LVERLNAGRAGKLVLLSAPAGYGKTALLGEWIAQADLSAAWLSLDEGEDDLFRFLAYVVAALQNVDLGIGREWADALDAPQPPPADEILTLLLNDLAATQDSLVLILDDYHAITAQAVHRALAFLLEHLPAQVLLVIAARADPPFSLSRLRGSGQLLELRAADLRFTHQEIAALFSHLAPADLSGDWIAALAARSEGWIAGLHMVALSLRDVDDLAGFVASLSGTQRHIADYLADQVLDRQPPDVQVFMLQTSILSRLSGSLCDVVTGRSGSQALLEQLERDNLFVVPLDDRRAWYRYHRLFADLLRVRLDRRWPGHARQLHRRASEWFAASGDLDAAIAHAMAGCDLARALALLDQHAEALWARGQYATLLKWLDELGQDRLRPWPRLRVHHALTSIMAGELSAGSARLQALERDLGTGSQDAAEQSFLNGMVAAGRAYLAYDQRSTSEIIAYARQALEHLPGSSPLWRGGLAVVLGSAYEHDGDVKSATQAFSDALAAGKALDSPFLSLTASVHLAINRAYQGQLRRAVAVCQEQLSTGRLASIPAAGTLHAAWGDVLREWNELRQARRHVEQGCRLSERGRGVAMRAWCRLALVQLCFSERDLAGAERVLQGLEGLAEAPSWVGAGIAAYRARIWLAQGKLDLAERLLSERGLGVDDRPSFLHLQEYMALARLRIAQGVESSSSSSLADAVRLLGRLRRATEAGGWTGKLIQVLVLLALARHAQGETGQSLSLLNDALILAEPEGFVRVFLDEGEWMTSLLRQAAARADLSAYARPLLSFACLSPVGPGSGASRPLIEPLSERELQVLRLIAEGLSNREIGERLFITTGTVKVHASNIYSKLGVSGRVQAVAWARELNLLP
jgi:LuxR family maltose regulon positive regulatory protein